MLVDVENDPTVKLIDLKMAEKIRDVKLRIQMYRQEHQYPPYKDVLSRDLFTLDEKKLGDGSSLYSDKPNLREFLAAYD